MSRRSVGELLAELEPLGVRLELSVFRSLLAVLGSPERRLHSVLVGGTNGKGSVAALLASIARRAGLRTGLYTSPHLERWEERLRLDGAPIPPLDLAARIESILAAGRDAGIAPPTVFEVLTAAALGWFADQAVDLAVLEVGLGGRLDATNVVEPQLSIVTRVALDHREWLGSDLATIAVEKAGIFRPGVPALLAPQLAVCDVTLARVAGEVGANLVRAPERVVVTGTEWRGLAGHRVKLRTERGELNLDLGLAGSHQIDNLATAVAAAEILAVSHPTIDRTAIESGVARARWPARLESVAVGDGGTLVLLDAAHNPDGCRSLERFLVRLDRPFVLLFGALADKQVDEMLPPLARPARAVVLTRPDSRRALDPARLEDLALSGAAASPPRVVPEPAAALDAALDAAQAAGIDLVVACGSIFLMGSVRRELRRRGAPLPAG